MRDNGSGAGVCVCVCVCEAGEMTKVGCVCVCVCVCVAGEMTKVPAVPASHFLVLLLITRHQGLRFRCETGGKWVEWRNI